MPNIIQLCNGILASGQQATTHGKRDWLGWVGWGGGKLWVGCYGKDYTTLISSWLVGNKLLHTVRETVGKDGGWVVGGRWVECKMWVGAMPKIIQLCDGIMASGQQASHMVCEIVGRGVGRQGASCEWGVMPKIIQL